jgi:hypothetical protein
MRFEIQQAPGRKPFAGMGARAKLGEYHSQSGLAGLGIGH